MEYITKSAEETQKLGRELGARLKRRPKPGQNAVVIALIGDLGSGKTVFTQGLAQGLGITARVLSPTFILLRNYGFFHHADLYRLIENVWGEMRNVGIADLIANPDNIIAIEWADKALEHLPKDRIEVRLRGDAEQERVITIKQ